MKKILVLVFSVILIFCGTNFSEGSESASVQNNLQAYLDGRLDDKDLEIEYSDLHGLWGGLRFTIEGTGKVRQETARIKAGAPHNLTKEEVCRIVQLLVELEAWAQKVPERLAQPDESRAYLIIKTGNLKSEIWEWYNDMKANDRLIRFLDLAKELIWKEAKKS